jgi:hypothetical protein
MVASQLGRPVRWYREVESGRADLLVDDALRLAAILGVDAADLLRVTPDGLDPARLRSALDGRTGVDSWLVEHLCTVGRALPKKVGQLPAPALAQWARAHLRSVCALLDVTMPGALKRRLESTAAESATLAGFLLMELGTPDRAGVYLRLAIRLADDAASADVRALALIFASELCSGARPNGRIESPPMARALLEAAARCARSGGPVRARALLRLAEERVFAGDETAAGRLLYVSDRVLGADCVPEAGILGWWDPAFALAYRGNVARLAGRPRQACRLLEDALRILYRRSPSRAKMTVELSRAYVEQGDIDHACELMGDACATAHEAGLKSVLRGIRRIRERNLAQYATERFVCRLDERLRASA